LREKTQEYPLTPLERKVKLATESRIKGWASREKKINDRKRRLGEERGGPKASPMSLSNKRTTTRKIYGA